MNIDLSYYSGIGKRKNNEDAVSVLENTNGLLAIVADGLGGMENGEIASKQAVKVMNDTLGTGRVSAEAMEAGIIKANREIYLLQRYYPGAHSTIAAVWLEENFAFAMHVGDTRIYQFRDDNVIYQSVDHSMAQMAALSGELKQEEIRTHKERNRLFRALGDSEAPKVAEKLLEIREGDRLLICSDGFWEKILETEMIATAKQTKNAEDWLRLMRARAEPAANDNNTAVAIVIH